MSEMSNQNSENNDVNRVGLQGFSPTRFFAWQLLPGSTAATWLSSYYYQNKVV